MGVQLIASAMAAEFFGNSVTEIGCFPVQGVSPSSDSLFSFPPLMEVFNWHGESFDLPSGANRLANSDGWKNQTLTVSYTLHNQLENQNLRAFSVACSKAWLSAFSRSDGSLNVGSTRMDVISVKPMNPNHKSK